MEYSEVYYKIADMLYHLSKAAALSVWILLFIIYLLSKAIGQCDYWNDEELLQQRVLLKARALCVLGIGAAVVYTLVFQCLFHNGGFFEKFWDIRLYKREGKTWQQLYEEGYRFKYKRGEDPYEKRNYDEYGSNCANNKDDYENFGIPSGIYKKDDRYLTVFEYSDYELTEPIGVIYKITEPEMSRSSFSYNIIEEVGEFYHYSDGNFKIHSGNYYGDIMFCPRNDIMISNMNTYYDGRYELIYDLGCA